MGEKLSKRLEDEASKGWIGGSNPEELHKIVKAVGELEDEIEKLKGQMKIDDRLYQTWKANFEEQLKAALGDAEVSKRLLFTQDEAMKHLEFQIMESEEKVKQIRDLLPALTDIVGGKWILHTSSIGRLEDWKSRVEGIVK